MIQGIRQIGRGLLRGVDESESVFAEYLIEEEKPKRGQGAHLVILKITTEPVSLDPDLKEINEIKHPSQHIIRGGEQCL